MFILIRYIYILYKEGLFLTKHDKFDARERYSAVMPACLRLRYHLTFSYRPMIFHWTISTFEYKKFGRKNIFHLRYDFRVKISFGSRRSLSFCGRCGFRFVGRTIYAFDVCLFRFECFFLIVISILHWIFFIRNIIIYIHSKI